MKKPPSGRCAHCLQYVGALTWDHVPPQSWYPESTPQNTGKWKVPSCENCQKRYKKIEEDLQLRITLGLDPAAPEAAGLVGRVHRSVDPRKARDEKDRRERQRRRKKFQSIVIPQDLVTADSIYPNFGPYPELAEEDIISIGIPTDSLKAVAEKVVRGAAYVLDGAFVEADTEITLLAPIRDEEARPIKNTIDRCGEWHSLGPGFRFGRGNGFFAVQIWGQLWIYGVVRKPSNVS